jgi:hypothetical protein
MFWAKKENGNLLVKNTDFDTFLSMFSVIAMAV